MRIRLLLSLLLPATLPAQWHLAVRTAVIDHAGHAFDALDAEEPTLGPADSRDIGVAVGLDRGRWRAAISVRTDRPDLQLVGGESGIITRGAFQNTDVGVEVGPRLLGRPGAPELHALAGVTVTRWSFPELQDPARNRLALTLATEGSLPLRGHLHGVLRLEGYLGASLFEDADLPEGYQARGARRLGLALGLRWRR